MTNGTVKWFDASRGFGFITPDEGGKDAFVHISALERSGITGLDEGQKVEYELQPGRDGKSAAENLRLVDGAGRIVPRDEATSTLRKTLGTSRPRNRRCRPSVPQAAAQAGPAGRPDLILAAPAANSLADPIP